MKILVLAPSMGSTGGIQRYMATLIRALKDTQGDKNVRVVAIPAEPRLRKDGELALPLGSKVRFFAAAAAQAIFWRPQIIVCAHIAVAPAARIIGSVLGVPYWIVLYGIEVWGKLPRAKERGLRGAQRLISISRFTSETTTARHQMSGVDVAILPPAFAIDETGTSAEPSLDTEANPPMVVTVGRLAASEQYKGHDIMLDSWGAVRKKIPNAMYCIVGDGDDRERLEGRTRELGVTDSVHFAGAVSASQLQDYYRRCRVFAMPSRTELNSQSPRGEGFGIVFLEAMAHGKPVLGPLTGAPSEFIRSGEHGILVDPADASAVANGLVELLADRDRAERMGRAARAWVIQEYSEEKFRQRLEKILRSDAGARMEISD